VFQEGVTIQDLAQVAGVSTQTVYRALNNFPDRSSEIRLRIQLLVTPMFSQRRKHPLKILEVKIQGRIQVRLFL